MRSNARTRAARPPSPPPPPPTVTRIVRGPGRYRGVKPGLPVEIPREWLDKEPTLETHTMSVEEWEAQQAQPKKAPAATPSRAKAPAGGGLRALVGRLVDTAAAQLEGRRPRVKG